MSILIFIFPPSCIILLTFCTNSHLTLPQVEPMIEHPDIVHHMLLYRCPSFVTQLYDEQCYMGDTGDACFGVVAAWAVGGGVNSLNHFVVFFGVYPCQCCVCVRWSTIYPWMLRYLSFQKMRVFLSVVRTVIYSTGWKSTTIIQTRKQVNRDLTFIFSMRDFMI